MAQIVFKVHQRLTLEVVMAVTRSKLSGFGHDHMATCEIEQVFCFNRI